MSELTYLWQKFVLEAFMAPIDDIPLRINAAQKAISARLRDKRQPDAYEHIALRQALNSLQFLMAECRRAKSRTDQNQRDTA